MGLTSMTGFADLAGNREAASWVWEARSVNGRNLDLKLRLPEGLEMLEAPLRAAFGAVLHRGSVSVSLRLGQGVRRTVQTLNLDALESAITAALAAGEAASRRGLDLAPMTAADLLGQRGVLEVAAPGPAEDPGLMEALAGQAPVLARALAEARRAEGMALGTILEAQVNRIAELAARAREVAGARAARGADGLAARLEAVLGAALTVDPDRLAQELAILAVKADVTEELDRLDAHVMAARGLLGAAGPVGRKLDFLTQEFNREANTLCAKAQSAELTSVGLDMKVVVDQLREQVQNVE